MTWTITTRPAVEQFNPSDERDAFLAAMRVMELNEDEAMAECLRHRIPTFWPLAVPAEWSIA